MNLPLSSADFVFVDMGLVDEVKVRLLSKCWAIYAKLDLYKKMEYCTWNVDVTVAKGAILDISRFNQLLLYLIQIVNSDKSYLFDNTIV